MTFREKYNTLKNGAVDFFFPPRCLCCGKLLLPADPLALCPVCLASYSLAARLPCRRCGKDTADCTCCSDLLVSAGVYRVAKAAPYLPEEENSPVRAVLFSLKHENSRDAKAFVARELARAARRMPEDLSGFTVTFVPRGRKGRRANGYDQMEDVSRLLAKELSLPWEPIARRSPNAKEQKDLDRKKRIENAKNSLLPLPALDAKGKRYLAVDDVLTTGASLAALASLLRSAGAAEVRAAVFAARG